MLKYRGGRTVHFPRITLSLTVWLPGLTQTLWSSKWSPLQCILSVKNQQKHKHWTSLSLLFPSPVITDVRDTFMFAKILRVSRLYLDPFYHINKSKVNSLNFLGGLLGSTVSWQKRAFFHSFRLHLKPYLCRAETVSKVCFNISYFLPVEEKDQFSLQSQHGERARGEARGEKQTELSAFYFIFPALLWNIPLPSRPPALISHTLSAASQTSYGLDLELCLTGLDWRYLEERTLSGQPTDVN